jgi:tetratricopeptide (TPR) repeat protein
MTREPPTPTAEQRRAASSQFERAAQVVAAGDYAHAVGLLADCCRIDPANLLYRQALRRAAKARYRNNGRGRWFAWLFNWPLRLHLMRAVAGARHLDAMVVAERILANNPWDVAAQRSLARAAEALGLLDVAIWVLEQARQPLPDDARMNRELARLYERRGNFTQALGLWERLHRAAPRDAEAAARLTQLARFAAPPAGAERSTPGPIDPVEREADALRKAIDDAPTDPGPRLALARLYRQAGRVESAQEALAAGLGPTGHDFALSVELADLAIEPFRRNLAIVRDKLRERDDEDLRQLEADLVREINTRELDLYRLQSDRQPGRPELRYELAVRLMRCGRTDEALTAFLESAAGWRASRGAAYCYRLWGNQRRALGHFEQALEALAEAEPDARNELLYELACCHAEVGEYERAVERGAELAERAPTYRDILTLLPAWQARARPAS